MSNCKENEFIVRNMRNIESELNTTLTDSFCVVGCNSAEDWNEDTDTPIFGTTKPLAYTYDGKKFFTSSSNILYDIRKVDFNGYQWIACGASVNNDQSLIVSSDGINWITPANNVLASANVFDVAWGNKRWVAVSSQVAYSTDGMNWTLSPYAGAGYGCVAYNGSYFLAGGFNIIGKSTDGITWTEVSVSGQLGNVNSITWNGNIWVATGSNAYPLGWSTDGETWNIPSQTLINSGSTVSYNGTIFLAAGVGVYKLVYSNDGVNWNPVNVSTTYIPGNITDMTWTGIYWIITSTTNNKKDPKVAYTSDLINWNLATEANNLFKKTSYVKTITSRNRKNYYLAYF